MTAFDEMFLASGWSSMATHFRTSVTRTYNGGTDTPVAIWTPGNQREQDDQDGDMLDILGLLTLAGDLDPAPTIDDVYTIDSVVYATADIRHAGATWEIALRRLEPRTKRAGQTRIRR